MHVREREESGIFNLRTESLTLLIILRWEVCERVYEGRETKNSSLDMCNGEMHISTCIRLGKQVGM